MKDVFNRTRSQFFLCLMLLAGPISAGDKIGETVGMAYDLDLVRLLPLAAIVVLASVVGDLTVSLYKRHSGIKDMGKLFPPSHIPLCFGE